MKAVILGFMSALAVGLLTPDPALTQDRRDRGREDDRAVDRRDRGDEGDRRIVIRGPEGSIVLDERDILRRIPRGDRRIGGFDRGVGEETPKFCRTGEGHPVFGIGWCFDRRMRDDGTPAFCRTGEGHPVFGRRWCLERGFGLGSIRGVIHGDDRVFLDIDGQEAVLAIEPSVWGRILDILVPRSRGR